MHLPWNDEVAARVLATQRGHALLLHGPQGVGQLQLAVMLAKAWLCEDRGEREQGLACGHCPSCRLIDHRAHPDLRLVVPEALREDAGLAGDEAAPTAEDGKKRKPSREIKVDQIRAALGFSELTAGRGTMKVLIVHPAEAVNAVSANALLKTLEEPQGTMRFLLCSAAPHQLLPTLRSRCQAVALAPPPREPATRWLVNQGQTPEDAAVLLAVSGGQPLLALEHASQGRSAALWRDFPLLIARQEAGAFATWPLPVLVDALQRLCHDAWCHAMGAPVRYFPQGALPGGDASRLSALARELRDWARHAEHPWNAPLSLETLLQRCALALASPGTARI